MPSVTVDIPASLQAALDKEVARGGANLSGVVTAALSKYLGVPVHTLFQVSISGALVAGVYDRELPLGVQVLTGKGRGGPTAAHPTPSKD